MIADFPEFLGGTIGEIVIYMQKALTGLDGGKYVNTRNVDNMRREYIALLTQGYKAPEIVSRPAQYAVKWEKQDYELSTKMSERLNVPKIVILNFFLALYDLSAKGKIPYKEYNPIQVKESIKQKEKVMGTPWYKKVGETTVMATTGTLKMIPILIAGAALFGVFLLSQYAKK